jgi:hypothetical protein
MKVGDKVLVWNSRLSGNVFAEGVGVVRKIVDKQFMAEVEFEDEPGAIYQRLVFDKDIIKDD